MAGVGGGEGGSCVSESPFGACERGAGVVREAAAEFDHARFRKCGAMEVLSEVELEKPIVWGGA